MITVATEQMIVFEQRNDTVQTGEKDAQSARDGDCGTCALG